MSTVFADQRTGVIVTRESKGNSSQSTTGSTEFDDTPDIAISTVFTGTLFLEETNKSSDDILTEYGQQSKTEYAIYFDIEGFTPRIGDKVVFNFNSLYNNTPYTKGLDDIEVEIKKRAKGGLDVGMIECLGITNN